MKAALVFSQAALAALVTLFAACSSSSTDPGTSDAAASSSGTSGGSSGTSGGSSGTSGGSSGTSGTSGTPDSGLDGGFDFVFTGGGTNIKQTDFKTAPVYGSFCMAAGNGGKTCSFTGSVTVASTGCTYILNIAYVSQGLVSAGTSFPVVIDGVTPPGKGTVNYTEICGGATKMWKATGGTITIDVSTPPAPGLATGTVSFSVQAATMAPAPNGAGTAAGTFSVAGKAANVSYTSPN